MAADSKAKRAAALKAEKTRVGRHAGFGQGPAQSPSPPPPLQRARHLRCRQANRLGED